MTPTFQEKTKVAALVPLMIAYTFAGPITYVLAVVDTWQGQASVIWKLFLSITLDAMVASLWPLTLILWLIMAAFGHHTPLAVVGIGTAVSSSPSHVAAAIRYHNQAAEITNRSSFIMGSEESKQFFDLNKKALAEAEQADVG